MMVLQETRLWCSNCEKHNLCNEVFGVFGEYSVRSAMLDEGVLK